MLAAVGWLDTATRISCPHCVQKALAVGTCVEQAGQVSVAGGGGGVTDGVGVFNAEPQCRQKAAPGLTSPLQCGQMAVDEPPALWVFITFTGAPHSGQNFFPVTSVPHAVHVDMGRFLLI